VRPPSALAPRLAGVLLAAVAATAAAAEPSLELSLEPRRFGIEDIARLTVRIVEPEGNPVVDLGELVNLEVVSGPSTGTEFSWVNGVATRATSFSYVVQGREVGQASVGPVRVVMGALELEAEAVSAEVVPGSVAPDRGAARRPPLGVDPFDDFFQRRQPSRSARVELRQLLDRREAVLGQTVTAVVVLDTTAGGVDGFEWVAPPTYPGWWAQRVDPPQRVTGEVVEVDGVRFNRFEIARHVLVPLKAGELAVPAAGARIGFRSASLFAPQQVVERSSPELTVSVAPRPPAPAGFSGAVGDLGYSVALDPEAIDFGESAVVTITLAGTGNLPLVEPPAAWPGCGDCESYPPEEESAVEVDTRGVHGSRSWRTTVVPRSAGVLELGPVELAVFDPAARRYRRQSLGPLTLTVAPPAATPVPVAAAAATGAGSGAGAAETAPRPEQPPAAGPPPWAWVVGALAAGLLVGGVPSLLLARRRRAGLPPRRAGQSPAERARELQVALERWWLDVRDSARGARLEEEMRELRRELEAVRFAPGRADHSETVADLEERLRRLMRR
jgi:hypothetical protein